MKVSKGMFGLVCIAMIVLLPSQAMVHAVKAYELTEVNFEHDTQATSGSTTGDWLILFCEYERFKRCNDYQPFWDELTGLLRGKTSVAYIDV